MPLGCPTRTWPIAAIFVAAAGACREPNPAWRDRVHPADAAPDRAFNASGGDGGRGGQAGHGGQTGHDGRGDLASGAGGGGGAREPRDTSDPVEDVRGPAVFETGPSDTRAADSAAVDERLAVGLVAQWSFTEPPATPGRVVDRRGNTAELTGLTFVDEAAPAMPSGSKSLRFDGAGYANLIIANPLESEGEKTIAVWYRSQASTPMLRNLVALFSREEVLNVGAQLGFSGTRLAMWRFGQSGAEATATAAQNSWQHAAYTFDGTIHRLYVDGEQRDEVPGVMEEGSLNRAMLGTYDPPDEMFTGLMNDVRIYARALSNDEIRSLARRP
jgi:Concanavalin A-like lectin/glucanases superfamily